MRTLIQNYTFNKSTKQVTFSDYVSIVLENVLLITDVTNNITIYQANDPNLGGSVAGNVLTLTYDTTGSSFANGDHLQIFYEVADNAITQPISGTVTANLGTIGGAATASNQTNGNQKSQMVGSGGTSVDVKSISTQVTTSDNGLVAHAVLHGYSSGLSAYTDVKANNNGALLVDASATTQPISATSLPLPSGAATSAKQPALGSAGTASSDVITVQGISGMTAIKVDGSASTQPVSGTVTANAGTGTFQTNVTNSSIPVTQSGTWNVNNISGTVSLPTGAATESTLSSLNGKVITTANGIKVDGSATTQPVSGTVTANAGSGSFTVAQATAANLNATVTGTVAATQSGTWNVNNVSGTVSLPTGAATSAKQPALGVAGTASSDVITVQGISGMTAIKVDGSATTQPVSGSISVSNFPATQPVSGSISVSNFPSTQNVAITSSVEVEVKNDSGNPLPISASSLPLPTGAATSAKQPALGSAGTASSDVITIQGISGMTAIKVDGSATTQPVSGSISVSNFPATQPVSGSISVSNFPATQPVSGTVTANAGTGTFSVSASSLPLPTGAATSANQNAIQGSATGGTAASSSQLSGGIYNSSAPSLTDGQQAGLQLSSSGALKVDSTGSTVGISGTVAATQSGAWNITNISGTVSLPTGAATESTLSAISTNTNSMSLSQGSTTSGQKGNLNLGAVTAAAPTYTTGQSNPLSLTTSGALRTDNSIANGTAGTGINPPTGGSGILGYLSGIQQATSAQATDTVQTGSITALNGTVAVNTQGAYTISILVTGTWTATLLAEGLLGDGTTWQQIPLNIVTASLPYSSTFTTTTNGTFLITGGGYTQARIRASAFTSGTVNIAFDASLAQQKIMSAQLGTWSMTASQATASSLNAQVVGNVAAGSADSGNPLKVGGVAKTAQPTAVTDGQRSNILTDKLGRVIVAPGHIRDLVTNTTTAITGTAETTVVAAVAATFNDLSTLVITNAANQSTVVTVRDATAGTARAVFNLAANGGVVLNLPVPWKQTAVNNNWTVQQTGTGTINIFAIAVQNI